MTNYLVDYLNLIKSVFPSIELIKATNLSGEERILTSLSSSSLSFKEMRLKGEDSKITLEALFLVLESLLIYIEVNRFFLILNTRSSSNIAGSIDILEGAKSTISLALMVSNSAYS